jgi:hypothetical protein
MIKKAMLLLLCVYPVIWSALAGASSPDPVKIMEKSEEARKLGAMTAKAVLITGGENQEKREKTFTWWRKLMNDGVHYSTLTRFHTPAEIRGQGILFVEHEDGVNDVLQNGAPNRKRLSEQ